MTFEEIATRVAELETEQTIPEFEIYLLAAVVAHIKAEWPARVACFTRAWFLAGATQHRLLRELGLALQGDANALGDLRLDGPCLMSKAGYAVLQAALFHLPDVPGRQGTASV